MTRKLRNLLLGLAAVAVLIPGAAVEAGQPLRHDALGEDILDNGTWAEVSGWLKQNKEVIELGEASIIIEVNVTGGVRTIGGGTELFMEPLAKPCV